MFDVDGNKISGCDDMTITPITTPSDNEKGYGYGYGYENYEEYGYGYDYNFGYGYGYGYGGSALNFKYKIILDTTDYETGDYESQLKALIGDKTFESKQKPEFTINGDFSGGDDDNDDNGDSDDDKKDDDENLEYCGGGFCDASIGETFETCPADCPKIIPLKGDKDKDTEIDEKEEGEPGFFAGITDTVVETLGTPGTVVVTVLLTGLLGSIITIRIVKRRRRLRLQE